MATMTEHLKEFKVSEDQLRSTIGNYLQTKFFDDLAVLAKKVVWKEKAWKLIEQRDAHLAKLVASDARLSRYKYIEKMYEARLKAMAYKSGLSYQFIAKDEHADHTVQLNRDICVWLAYRHQYTKGGWGCGGTWTGDTISVDFRFLDKEFSRQETHKILGKAFLFIFRKRIRRWIKGRRVNVVEIATKYGVPWQWLGELKSSDIIDILGCKATNRQTKEPFENLGGIRFFLPKWEAKSHA